MIQRRPIIKESQSNLNRVGIESYDWLKSFNRKKHSLKMDFKYILFRKLPFCRFMHSLCENKNVPM